VTIKFYIVGGYVRDRVLGREAKDHDFVVTGATAVDMKTLGYIPIEAQAFPVFHHPKTRDEYALARTEKKTGEGYHGFEVYSDPEITIEEDLLRRDLTCNAMAREVLSWNEAGFAKLSDEIIDPYGGVEDLRNGVLRHVSDAFAEDPVRVLRVARFAARYNFSVAPETMDLMRSLVKSGELDHLTEERVWKELEGALTAEQPTKFFWTLEACGAKDVLFPELGRSLIHSGYGLSRAALRNADMFVRYMLLTSLVDLDKADEFYVRLKAPNDIQRLATKFNRLLRYLKDRAAEQHDPEKVLKALHMLDAFRRPDDMVELSSALGFASFDSRIESGMDALLTAFREARKVSFATLTVEQQAVLKGEQIGLAIDQTRLEKIKEVV